MNTKTFLLGILLLLIGPLCAAEELQFVTLSVNGTETVHSLSSVQKIIFENNAMTVQMKTKEAADVTDIKKVSFRLSGQTGMENLQSESSVVVFPNPAKTNITVSGVAENVIINLFNLNGSLLQRTIAGNNLTDMDVSSLKPGVYLLQVGEQFVKFIKQ